MWTKKYSVFVFEVTDYEFNVRFYEFKIADPMWLPYCMVAMVFIDNIIHFSNGIYFYSHNKRCDNEKKTVKWRIEKKTGKQVQRNGHQEKL